jgi:3-dehydroquinate synthase
MRTVTINASRKYEVNIGKGLLDYTAEYVSTVLPPSKIALITDDIVDKLYRERVEKSLVDGGYSVVRYVMKNGEKSKSPDNYIKILQFLASEGLTKSDGIVALGGGVVGDIAGFAASTYKRGIGYIQMPTTLLAAIDSSVGGKTAIDLPEGKNLVGVIYQPLKVICDIDTLQSLPDEIFKDGLAEGVKYGILEGGTLWTLLERGVKEDLGAFVEFCVAAKKRYVEADETDSGVRMQLNLGHTIAHAIEKLSGYSMLHGFAVAKGMAMIGSISNKKGLLGKKEYEMIINMLLKYGFDISCGYSAEAIIKTVSADKKIIGGIINLILARSIGDVFIERVPLKNLEEYLNVCCD